MKEHNNIADEKSVKIMASHDWETTKKIEQLKRDLARSKSELCRVTHELNAKKATVMKLQKNLIRAVEDKGHYLETSGARITKLQLELVETKESWRMSSVCRKFQQQRDIAIDAIKEIMANEEGLHRMGYNPYLISHAAMEKINNYET